MARELSSSRVQGPRTDSDMHAGPRRAALPFALKKIAPDEPAVRSRIAARFSGGPLPVTLDFLSDLLGEGKIALRLAGISHSPAPEQRDLAVLALAARKPSADRRFVLGLPLSFGRQIVELALKRPCAELGGRSLSQYEQGVLIYALDRAAGDWIQSGGERPVFRCLLADSAQITEYLGGQPDWRVDAEIAGAIEARVSLWFRNPVPPLALRPPRASLLRAAEWPARVRLCIGHSRLAIEDVNGLAKGDVVIVDSLAHPRFGGSNSVRLQSGRFERSGYWLDDRRIALGARFTEEYRGNMDNEQRVTREISAEFAAARPAEAGALEVVVRVQVGELALTVEQATSLAPGCVIKLDRPVGPCVGLWVGDKQIGSGQLVEHNGELAVEITEVA